MKKEMELQEVLPGEIERRSMEIITEELGEKVFDPKEFPIIKRVIHTTADFDFAENLYFSPGAVETAARAIRNGAGIVTDTNMAMAGINKKVLAQFGGQVYCFMADEKIAQTAKEKGITRASASMDQAAALPGSFIFAIGNAPTALVRLCQLMEQGILKPACVIGVPVGFVNVIESKKMLMEMDVPMIVARGRKGGSAVAATIINAILYEMAASRL